MSVRRKHQLAYAVLIAAALLMRLTVTIAAVSGENRLFRPDTSGYLTPAAALAENLTYPATRRPIGFPLLAAAVYRCGGNNVTLAFVLAVFGTLSVAAVAAAAHLYGGFPIGITAGILYALNPTNLGNTPLLLSDTFAGFFAALQFLFFVYFQKKRKIGGFYAAIATAALGALIRPINSLWLLPALFLLFITEIPWKKKLLYSAVSTLIFFAVITPWMFRNYRRGAGFCIDTNTGAMYHQNGAMLLGEISGRGYEAEKQRIIREQEELFTDTVRFPDEASREKYRIARYRELVISHFPIWLKQQCNWQILLPDVPSLLEAFGLTTSDRGTMAVLKEQGLFPAVRHYFGENYLRYLLLLLPLLAITALTYCGVIWQLGKYLCSLKENYFEIFVFLAFAEYYLFLPGAITAPRYQIPALPVMCTLAAAAMISVICKKTPPADENIPRKSKV